MCFLCLLLPYSRFFSTKLLKRPVIFLPPFHHFVLAFVRPGVLPPHHCTTELSGRSPATTETLNPKHLYLLWPLNDIQNSWQLPSLKCTFLLALELYKLFFFPFYLLGCLLACCLISLYLAFKCQCCSRSSPRRSSHITFPLFPLALVPISITVYVNPKVHLSSSDLCSKVQIHITKGLLYVLPIPVDQHAQKMSSSFSIYFFHLSKPPCSLSQEMTQLSSSCQDLKHFPTQINQ